MIDISIGCTTYNSDKLFIIPLVGDGHRKVTACDPAGADAGVDNNPADADDNTWPA